MKLYSYIQSSLTDNILHGTINYLSYTNKIGNLCIFFFLFILGVFLLKKIKLFYSTNACRSRMYITDKIYLSPSQYLCILHVEKFRFLLSITVNSIHVIHILPDSKEVVLKKNKPCLGYIKLLNILKSTFCWFR
ncbi:MAG: flagellar biosynthetic protein FliO [Janthinobacterium lividum]